VGYFNLSHPVEQVIIHIISCNKEICLYGRHLQWKHFCTIYASIRLLTGSMHPYPFVRPFVRYRSRKHAILKINQQILMQMDTNTSGPRGKSVNDQLWGPGGQSSRSHEAEVRFEGLAEASFSTPFVSLVEQLCSFKTSSEVLIYFIDKQRTRLLITKIRQLACFVLACF